MVADPVYAPKTNFTSVTTVQPTFRVVPPDTTFYPPVPVKYADISVTNVVKYGTENGRPVKIWENTRTYPDHSTSLERTSVDETYKTGSHSITVVSPDGSTSTTSETFSIPNYKPNSTAPIDFDVVKTSPISSTPLPINTSPLSYPVTPIDPVTGYPTPSTVTPVTGTVPTSATGQDLINAPMPSYAFPALAEFVPFDLQPVTDIMSGANVMFTNIGNQLTSATTAFDSTKALLNGGWTAPVYPSGSCGESLAFDFHGKHVDLCPPLINFTAKSSPIVEPMVTIGGMVTAITIFFGGF